MRHLFHDGSHLLNPWQALTSAGDSALLLPLIAWISLWLIVPAQTRREGWRWAFAVCACGGGVALSKLLFMAWGVGLPGLDYTGFSGHSAMSMLVWPTMAALLTQRASLNWRSVAVCIAVVLALGIAVSRILLKAHSVSEVILGSSYGILICGWFLMRRSAAYQVSARAVALFAGIGLALALACYGRVFPSQHILKQLALDISGRDKVFSRVTLPH